MAIEDDKEQDLRIYAFFGDKKTRNPAIGQI